MNRENIITKYGLFMACCELRENSLFPLFVKTKDTEASTKSLEKYPQYRGPRRRQGLSLAYNTTPTPLPED